MSIKKLMRWGWSISLCCLIFLNFNIQSAKAEINFNLPSVQPVNINTDFISDSAKYLGDRVNNFVNLPSVQPVNINTDFISDSAKYLGDGVNNFVKKGNHKGNHDLAIESLSDGFISGFGQVGGSIAGATAACYVADVAVLPIAPPVAAAVATYCPYIGGIAGSFSGVVVTKTAKKQAANLSKNSFKALVQNKNHKLIPALF